MNLSYRLIAPALLAGALMLPGAAMAQSGGNSGGQTGANGATGKMMNSLPSQRIVNNSANGQGAALVIAPSGVREVQQALNRLGYDSGPINGSWNKRTQLAMQNFQAAHGLSPNGDLTLSSIAALGLWNNLIGNPNGNGNRPLIAKANGAPPVRGTRSGGQMFGANTVRGGNTVDRGSGGNGGGNGGGSGH